jgi:ribosome-associated translation inhibitor RaiA
VFKTSTKRFLTRLTYNIFCDVMVVFEQVETVHFPDVDEIDRGIVEKNFQTFLEKVNNGKELPTLHLSFKQYDKGGLKKQHEIHAKLTIDGDIFIASHTDWQLIATIQSVLTKLEKEVLKKHSKK